MIVIPKSCDCCSLSEDSELVSSAGAGECEDGGEGEGRRGEGEGEGG